MFLVVFKKHQMEITDPYSPLLGVSSESEKKKQTNKPHLTFENVLLENTSPPSFSGLGMWILEVGKFVLLRQVKSPFSHSLVGRSHLCSEYELFPEIVVTLKKASYFFMIVNRLKRGRAHTGGA